MTLKYYKAAPSGFSEADLAESTHKIIFACDKVETQLADGPWLVGDTNMTADINFYSHCGIMVNRMLPELDIDHKSPLLADWRARMEARPGVKAALEMPDHTNPELRTFTGHAK